MTPPSRYVAATLPLFPGPHPSLYGRKRSNSDRRGRRLPTQLQFLPGQWVDTFCPGIANAGGFTITSPPSAARTAPVLLPAPGADALSCDPGEAPASPPEPAGAGTGALYRYVELAVRRADDSPVTTFLWRNPAFPAALLGTPLRLRVGGSFVYPPPGVPTFHLRRLVLVAGGVGVNPLVSIATHLSEQTQRPGPAGVQPEVRLLYSLRDVAREGKLDEMLFVPRLAGFFAKGRLKGTLRLFLTPGPGAGGERDKDQDSEDKGVMPCNGLEVSFARRRISADDITEAVGPDPRFAAAYVCGVPLMTDTIVAHLLGTRPEGVGMEKHRVLFEKWW